jgi:hypothetical protein
MVAMVAGVEEQRNAFQFGPDVKWVELDAPARTMSAEEAGMRAMYARLARAHEAEPTVPDLGGGAPGDLYQL